MKTVCNQENGCMSELFGRQCWIADSMLKLIIAFVDEKGLTNGEVQICKEVEGYCTELREKNRNYFDNIIEEGTQQ